MAGNAYKHGLRPKVIAYQEAFDRFVAERKTINTAIDKGTVASAFNQLIDKSMHQDAVAMDVLAYYYKSGITNFLPENYTKYLHYELLACAKGNNFAIDKMQFLFTNVYNQILDSEDLDVIVYLNDVTEDNFAFIFGKEIAKVMVKKYSINAEDLANQPNEKVPFKNEMLIEFKKDLQDATPEIIEKLK